MLSQYEADTILNQPESTHGALKKAFKMSLARRFFANRYLDNPNINAVFINDIVSEIANEQEWCSISVFLRCSRLAALLSQETKNQVMLLAAHAFEWEIVSVFLELFSDQFKASYTAKVLLVLVSQPIDGVESFTQIEVVQRILELEIGRPDMGDLKDAHIKAIQSARARSVALFEALGVEYQPEVAKVVTALKGAAESKKYEFVLERIETIPNERLSILKTESENKNILHWAVGRKVKRDIETILNSLNSDERFELITETSDVSVGSPLSYASRRGWKENMTILLDSLSEDQQLLAILPRKVSFNTPLYRAHSSSMAPLLDYLFKDKLSLYSAYSSLNEHCSLETVKQLRDFYLLNHYSNQYHPRKLRLFISTFSIPGHSLSTEDLDLVARVVFYIQYHELDYRQRGKIEEQMEDHDRMQTQANSNTCVMM